MVRGEEAKVIVEVTIKRLAGRQLVSSKMV